MLAFIYGLCFMMLFVIMMVVLLSEGKFCRGFLLGVKLPVIAEQDEDILKLAKAYKKSVWLTLIICVLLYLPVNAMFESVSFQLVYFLLMFMGQCFFFEVPYVVYHQKLRVLKREKGFVKLVTYADPIEDERFWKYGIFYYNADDSRTMVTKRVGIGMTLNYALKTAWNWTWFTVIFLIGSLLICFIPIFGHEFSMPFLEVKENNQVEINCFQYGTTFDLEEVTAIYLLEQLPGRTKLNGISTSNIMRGHFAFKGMGKGLAYIYLETPPYIIFEFEDTFIAYNEGNPDQTELLYEVLLNRIEE